MERRVAAQPARSTAPREVITLLVVLLSAGACAPRRVTTPVFQPSPHVAERDLRHVQLELCGFDVPTKTRRDRRDAVASLRRSFVRYLEEAGRYGAVTGCDPEDGSRFLTRVQLDARLFPNHDTTRSWIFDALFFSLAPGYFPFTPAWGRARVETHLELRARDRKIAPVNVEASAPWSMIFYSWYRSGPVVDAYRRVYDASFREAAQRVARRIEEAVPLPATVLSTSTATVATATSSAGGVTLVAETNAVSEAMAVLEAQEIRLPETGLRLIREPVDRTSDNLFLRYLSALGGLEASKTGGTAIVRSRAATTFNGVQTVGSGRATSSGYRFALYSPPDRTGFFFPPRFGFFSQDIEISGFREELPTFRNSAGASDIPAVVTDPTTGVPVDVDEPIAYDLRLKSGYVGQGIGFNFVFGTDDVQLFSTLQTAVNAFEVRHTGVTINRENVEGYSAELFGSGQVSAQIGLEVPDIHLAFRAAWEFEWFRSFDYPEPLEFQASVAYNPEKMVFERERVFVEGATLFTFNWQLSAIYSF